jgi:hypothetical protein
VYVNSSKPVKSVLLVSLTGNIISRTAFNQSQPALIQVPVDAFLSPGIYIIQVLAADGSVQHAKLIKE